MAWHLPQNPAWSVVVMASAVPMMLAAPAANDSNNSRQGQPPLFFILSFLSLSVETGILPPLKLFSFG
jgi:hypothetical protein